MAADFSYANLSVANGLEGVVGDQMKRMGKMFYLISPQDTMYEHKEDVPNFYRQVSCFFNI